MLWLKYSLASKTFLGVSRLVQAADRTPPLDVSGLLASQTDLRKTVACYVINTEIVEIWGVLDSISLHVSPPGTVTVFEMVNQVPLRDLQTSFKHILFRAKALGQQAKVIFLLVWLLWCVHCTVKDKKKNPQNNQIKSYLILIPLGCMFSWVYIYTADGLQGERE